MCIAALPSTQVTDAINLTYIYTSVANTTQDHMAFVVSQVLQVQSYDMLKCAPTRTRSGTPYTQPAKVGSLDELHALESTATQVPIACRLRAFKLSYSWTHHCRSA
jgi:hypothetical protein